MFFNLKKIVPSLKFNFIEQVNLDFLYLVQKMICIDNDNLSWPDQTWGIRSGNLFSAVVSRIVPRRPEADSEGNSLPLLFNHNTWGLLPLNMEALFSMLKVNSVHVYNTYKYIMGAIPMGPRMLF